MGPTEPTGVVSAAHRRRGGPPPSGECRGSRWAPGGAARIAHPTSEWSRARAWVALLTLLPIGSDLIVQQTDKALRDTITSFKPGKDAPNELTRPGDPPLIPRPNRCAEFGEFWHR